MNIFLGGPKNRKSTFWMSAFGLTIFGRLFVKEIKCKVSFACIKSLTNCENSSSNPFQRACSGCLKAACVSKSCSESLGVILKIVSLEKNRPMSLWERRNRKQYELVLEVIGSKQNYTDKKKIKFSSYIRKFRVEQLQSHLWLTASSYMGK